MAAEASVEVDECLVRLWGAGVESVVDPDDFIPANALKAARRALGLGREGVTEGYWRDLFGMSAGEFAVLLTTLNIRARPGAKRLPKGAVAKLRAEARRRGVLLSARQEHVAAAPTPSYFPWRAVGREADLHHLDAKDVLQIHNALVLDFAASPDPIEPAGVKNEMLLESAVGRPLTSNGTERKYPTVESAAAALLHSLTQNHAFHNGNKRTALVSLLVFLERHGVLPTCSEDDLFRLVLQVAQHSLPETQYSNRADAEVFRVADWLVGNSRVVDKAERPLPWRKLKQVLASFGCEFATAPSVGNRLNIERRVPRSGIFSFLRSREVLRIQVFYRDNGSEAQKDTIADIREALELDEAHGVDSRAFYDQEPMRPSDFIVEYRKTLRRLGRM